MSLTNNPFSAQPAVGDRSPRIFIIINNLFISTVPEGRGSDVVEFSVLTSNGMSIKAEIPFPVLDDLSMAAPYENVRYQNGTSCSVCHTVEIREPSITFTEAFTSVAFQPRPQTLVPLESFRNEYNICNPSNEPERCAIIRSLFGRGEVQTELFPSDMPFAFSF